MAALKGLFWTAFFGAKGLKGCSCGGYPWIKILVACVPHRHSSQNGFRVFLAVESEQQRSEEIIKGRFLGPPWAFFYDPGSSHQPQEQLNIGGLAGACPETWEVHPCSFISLLCLHSFCFVCTPLIPVNDSKYNTPLFTKVKRTTVCTNMVCAALCPFGGLVVLLMCCPVGLLGSFCL